VRIATWNINSIRHRLALLRRVVRALDPDVLCLQETKVEDALFPEAACRAMGFDHLVFHGQKAYHGVAVLSRIAIAAHEIHSWGGNGDARHVMATLGTGLEVHNVYVPAGGDEPDPAANPKFAHKLRFLDEIAAWFAGRTVPKAGAVLVGDLNIAPLEHDVWSHKQLLDVVSHTPVEVAKLERLQRTQGWVDAVRRFVPADRKLYSWWSYRARDWAASDRGRRLDHVWVTPGLTSALVDAAAERRVRGWARASDHVPVWVDVAPGRTGRDT
jgi:exodeoxyribonuclease-3